MIVEQELLPSSYLCFGDKCCPTYSVRILPNQVISVRKSYDSNSVRVPRCSILPPFIRQFVQRMITQRVADYVAPNERFELNIGRICRMINEMPACGWIFVERSVPRTRQACTIEESTDGQIENVGVFLHMDSRWRDFVGQVECRGGNDGVLQRHL